MYFLTKHWYDLGAIFSLVILALIYLNYDVLSSYQLLMWVSLVTLFLHQLEEYRIVGTFPGMVNSVMYKSKQPDRYPLNPKTSLYVNVLVGWGSYLSAAIFAEKAVWLGIGTILVSVGNTFGHTFLFNLKGKTLYNAGLATCWLLFVPATYFFIHIILSENLVSTFDYFLGIPLGVALNYFGILKLIDWMADENTPYIFPSRNLLKKDRK